MNPTIRAESNPPVFGRERDLLKARTAIDYHERAVEAAALGFDQTIAKRAKLVAQLDQQVAQAEVECAVARERLEGARRHLATLEGDT